MKLLELKQKRAALIDQMTNLASKVAAESRGMDTAETEQWNKLVADEAGYRKSIEAIETATSIETNSGARSQARGSRLLAPGEFRALSADERFADLFPADSRERPLDLGKTIRGIVTGNFDGAQLEHRALMESAPTGGATLLPTPLSAQFIDLSRAQVVAARAGARFVPMTTATLKLARLDQDVTFNWKGELATSPLTQHQFSGVQLAAKTVVATVQISRELLDDAENASELLTSSMTAALGREIDRVILNGKSVSGEPTGILNATGTQSISMGTNGGSIAGYSQMVQALKLLASVNGNITAAAAVMHPNVASEFWGLTNSLGDAMKIPKVLENVPFLDTTSVPTNLAQGTAPDTSPIVAGAFDKVLVGVRNNMEIAVSQSGYDGTGESFLKYGVLVRIVARIDVVLTRPNQLVIINGVI